VFLDNALDAAFLFNLPLSLPLLLFNGDTTSQWANERAIDQVSVTECWFITRV
jgi:hypothetical protein